jgi:hypothetical protein
MDMPGGVVVITSEFETLPHMIGRRDRASKDPIASSLLHDPCLRISPARFYICSSIFALYEPSAYRHVQDWLRTPLRDKAVNAFLPAHA